MIIYPNLRRSKEKAERKILLSIDLASITRTVFIYSANLIADQIVFSKFQKRFDNNINIGAFLHAETFFRNL